MNNFMIETFLQILIVANMIIAGIYSHLGKKLEAIEMLCWAMLLVLILK
jgi:hypothetical protein